MRRRPSPLSVTNPPPSRTTWRRELRTLAVAPIRIVIGLGPHEKLIRPPARTAATTAEEVQLRAVPCPITRVEAPAAVDVGPIHASALTQATAAARRLIAGMLGPG